jgi:hypothetical protein
VRQLDGYSSSKISPPDLDRLIGDVSDKETIKVSVYVNQGHPFVVVSCAAWTWEYDVTLQRWHERKSYNLLNWRGMLPFFAFGKWLCGSSQNANLHEITKDAKEEDEEPLIVEIETAPQGQFPNGMRINQLDLFVTAAVGVGSGEEPIETNPSIAISISKDLGISWSNEWIREIGPQGLSPMVRVNNLGIVKEKGVKFKFVFSDPVHFALMGGAFEGVPLNVAPFSMRG